MSLGGSPPSYFDLMFTVLILLCCYNSELLYTGVATSILSAVKSLNSSLMDFIEPDFELLDHLLRLDVLNYRQIDDIREEKPAYKRNGALLDLLTSEDQCVKFMHALQLTGQQHVVNFIKENGGQKHSHVLT